MTEPDVRLTVALAQQAELERFAYDHALERLGWGYIAEKARRAPEHGGLGRSGLRPSDLRRAAGRMASRILDKAALYEDEVAAELGRLRAERDAAFAAHEESGEQADWAQFRTAEAAICDLQQVFLSALDPDANQGDW